MPRDNNAPSRDPRREAAEMVGTGLDPVVLEPSPPAVHTGPWFADDPVERGEGAVPVLAPSGIGGDLTWDAWLVDQPERARWVAERWLGGPRRLPSPPPNLAATRTSLHRLAAYVIAPTRHRSNGKFGLRWTLGGFGTPFFGDDRQVRVAGDRLIDQRDGSATSVPITTLAAAAKFLGTEIDPDTATEHDTPATGDPHETLLVESESSAFLGGWFGMAFAGLEIVRADAATVEPSRPQLWPGHFDPAIEAGDEDHRASFGASPGDGAIDEPYLYVSVWWPERAALDVTGPLWNAPGFTGRILRLSDFPDGDPVEVATQFWRSTRDLLN